MPFFARSVVERDEDRRLVVLARLDGEHAALGGLDREAHDRLIDRADLFDVERPVGQALALRAAQLQGHQPFEDAQQAPVGHGQDPGRLILQARPSRNGNSSGSNSLPPRACTKPVLWPLWIRRNSASKPPQPPRRSSIVSGLSVASSVSFA